MKGSNTYPEVLLDPESGIFTIEGKSVPEDGKTFYAPVLKWLDDYFNQPAAETHFIFKLDYFNISTSKMILFILYKLNELKGKGHSVKITWYYKDEDDEMLEVGEDYEFMIDIPFEYVRHIPVTAS